MSDDPLSAVLGHVGVRGTIFCRAELGSPWAVKTRALPHAIFHIAIRGGGYLILNGQPHAWRAGDLLLLPRGVAHMMCDQPVESLHAAASMGQLPTELGDDGLPCLTYGGSGAPTSILCGTFEFGGDADALLLTALPDLLHVRSEWGTSEWFDLTLRMLGREARAGLPGGATVVSRLTEILLVHALRVWSKSADHSEPTWLSALNDPVIARGLERIHAEPGFAWDVGTLAKSVGVSRSSFHTRFTAATGQTPAAYLTGWRMVLAQRALRQSDQSLVEIAQGVGYGSEAAFSRAFKRHTGHSPGAWRREARHPA